MDGVGTRLDKLAKALGCGLSRISTEIGLSTSTLTLAKKSKNGIPSEYIRMIVERYPQVNAMYLVMGEGDVIMNEKKNPVEQVDYEGSIEKIEKAEILMLQLKAELRDFRNMQAGRRKSERK